MYTGTTLDPAFLSLTRDLVLNDSAYILPTLAPELPFDKVFVHHLTIQQIALCCIELTS